VLVYAAVFPSELVFGAMHNNASTVRYVSSLFFVCDPAGGHNVALEIQATLPINAQHKSTVPRMEKGVHITFVVTALAYFLVSIFGFYAFGTGVADNVLLTFSHGPTSWVVAMAGGCAAR
jgi:ABC-type phosphate/phosphonate transport system permease subunit